MQGGILGRIDDMIVVRGNNIFPSSIEAIVRGFSEVAEFRIEAIDDGSLTQLRIDIESSDGIDGSALSAQIARAVQDALNFRPEVQLVAAGSLPRSEMKSRRFVRRRTT